MNLTRRQFLQATAAGAAQSALPIWAGTQDYPTRPVHVFVGFPPGGTSDLCARLIGQSLSERLKQPFVIENRPGAGSNLATEAVVNARGDGYTLLLVNAANAINETLYDKLNFKFRRDIAPVAGLIRAPLVMVVNPSFPAKTIPEFIAYAKSNAANISMATAGNGTSPHVAGELFKMTAGINMVDVPYRGGSPALVDLIANQVQVMFATIGSAIGYIKAGKLRPLGVTTAQRSEALPDTPAIGDYVPGYEASDWYGMGAPKATATDIVERLNQEINAALAEPRMKVRLAEMGATPLIASTDNFKTFIGDEVEKWGKVVKFSGAKIV